jgi:hypothetical protein
VHHAARRPCVSTSLTGAASLCMQWFAKARRQATLALNRAKSVNYDPLEDPKYSFDAPEEDDDDDDDDEEEE